MNQGGQLNQDLVLYSPMAGKIVKILAHEGDLVKQGQSVFIIESMKMLHELRVAKPGKMANITVKEGDFVSPNSHLASLLCGQTV